MLIVVVALPGGVLEKAGTPVPLKSRPGVPLITASGQKFEHEQSNVLRSSLPNNAFARNSGTAPVDLRFPTSLQLEPEYVRVTSFTNMGVVKNDEKFIPKISGLRPDIIVRRCAPRDRVRDPARRLYWNMLRWPCLAIATKAECSTRRDAHGEWVLLGAHHSVGCRGPCLVTAPLMVPYGAGSKNR